VVKLLTPLPQVMVVLVVEPLGMGQLVLACLVKVMLEALTLPVMMARLVVAVLAQLEATPQRGLAVLVA
jgi:hypothetical protein